MRRANLGWIGLAAGVLGLPQAAHADDWRSLCTFDAAGLTFVVEYAAGDPSYSIVVTYSGSSELGRGQRIGMNVLQTDRDTVLFSKSDDAIQILLRVGKSDVTATVEIGSGLSLDYMKLSGRCKAL